MIYPSNFRTLSLVIVLVMAVCGSCFAQRTYTTNADFESGILQAVQDTSVPDQLQLNPDDCNTLPFIWVPNDNGTISKVSTSTGKELGRYRVVPPDLPDIPPAPPLFPVARQNFGSPSRTTVGLDGSCWVGCRTAGTVVKIGLLEAGQWIDRNGDGIVQTSRDLNNDGVISGSEILPWGQDECVLYEVVLVPGHEGVHYPGDYPGPYDNNDATGTSPRALAVDTHNDLWVGSWGLKKYYHIVGATTSALPSAISIDRIVDVAPHTPYGAVIDRFGVLWSAGRDVGDVLRMDFSTNPASLSSVQLPHSAYGMALDFLDHLFVTGFSQDEMSRINITNSAIDWTKAAPGLFGSRGAVCTHDNDVWVANSFSNTVTRYDNDGNLKATIDVGAEPTGVAVDANGKVWACDHMDEFIYDIDPATDALDIIKELPGTIGHYSYSDMTGSISRCITTNTGTWTVINDNGKAGSIWDKVSWNDQPGDPDSGVYPGSSLTVTVQSSDDLVTFSAAETVGNGVPLKSTPPGRYLRVAVSFQRTPSARSPILYDLTVTPKPPAQPRDQKLYQAYCGKSCDPIRDYRGFRGRGVSDLITAVPGVLAIDPGGDNWANFVSVAASGTPYTVTNTSLRKAVPVYVCSVPIGGKPVLQQGTRNIRMWWPLMYELPGTKWTLTISYKLGNPPGTNKQDVWTWQVDATLDSMKNLVELFHELPAGSCQVPLISSEALYVELLSNIVTLQAMNPTDPEMAEVFNSFILLVEDSCLTVDCGTCTHELGIRNTVENPACCKILADLDYIAQALGVFK
jgi:streptogramin lyase